MWPSCGLKLANPLLDNGQACRQFDTGSRRERTFASFLCFCCAVKAEDLCSANSLSEGPHPTTCTNTDHSPPEQALKSTGLSRLTDNWMRECAGGETRLWKAKCRPSPHEIPRRRNVGSAIHFVFFGFNSGRKRPIQFHSYPTNLAYISRHGFTVHTMGSDFLLPVDRNLFLLSQTFYFAVILQNVTTVTSLHCWKQMTAARCHIRTATGRFHDLIKKLLSHRPSCGEGGVLCGILYLGIYSDRHRGKRGIKRYFYLETDL